MPKRASLLVVALVLGLAAAPGLPPAAAPAEAVPLPGNPPPHWGTSPFFPDCVEGPCRAVLVIDKTFDPAWSSQIRRWVAWMTFVRTNFNFDLPAFGYVSAADGVLPDPSCSGFPASITLCKNDRSLAADCGPSPGAVACTHDTRAPGTNHFFASRISFREEPLALVDVWNVVCSQMGRAIGLSLTQPDPTSCMHSPILIGSGIERYLVVDDWQTLWAVYDHTPGT